MHLLILAIQTPRKRDARMNDAQRASHEQKIDHAQSIGVNC